MNEYIFWYVILAEACSVECCACRLSHRADKFQCETFYYGFVIQCGNEEIFQFFTKKKKIAEV